MASVSMSSSNSGSPCLKVYQLSVPGSKLGIDHIHPHEFIGSDQGRCFGKPQKGFVVVFIGVVNKVLELLSLRIDTAIPGPTLIRVQRSDSWESDNEVPPQSLW